MHTRLAVTVITLYTHDLHTYIVKCIYLHVPVLSFDCLCDSGVGRYRNESYGEFLKTLNSAQRLTTRIGPREVHINIYLTFTLFNFMIVLYIFNGKNCIIITCKSA